MLTLILVLIGVSIAYFAARHLQKTLLFQHNKNAIINDMLSIIRTQEELYVKYWTNPAEPEPEMSPITELQRLLDFGRRRYSINTQDIEKEDLQKFVKYATGGKHSAKQRTKDDIRVKNIHAAALDMKMKLLENKI